MVMFNWHACKYKAHKLHQRYILIEVHHEDVPLVELYLVFTCMPSETDQELPRVTQVFVVVLVVHILSAKLLNTLVC